MFQGKILLIITVWCPQIFAQVSGLSGWNIYLDPGHSRTENMGVNGYSEAEEVLRVGLQLKDLLLTKTDIDTVYISRTNDQQQVSLSQRTDHANSLGAAWYHSIHSNAGPPDHNNTLLLWGQLDNGTPDPPVGGEAMSEIMIDILTRGMQIPSIGSWGDCSFYTWSTFCANYGGPYLWVNRHTTMPSELSEEGHHTNPSQNQLYMNVEYKRLLAYTFFWSILKHHGIQRPQIKILTGIISDEESGHPINGASAVVGNQSYTTDTYDSLFNQYTADPELLRNGFYFFEELEEDTASMAVSAEGFYADTFQVVMSDTFFTFKDITLVSSVPPWIVETNPDSGDTLFPAWDPVIIQFSRTMNLSTVEDHFTIEPPAEGTFTWSANNKLMTFHSDSLIPLTEYIVTISDSAQDQYGHLLDGNSDGDEGGIFTLSFRTGPPDMDPPEIVWVYPPLTSNSIELNPIINISFDEVVGPENIVPDVFRLEKFQDHSDVLGTLIHYLVGSRSVLNFFPDNPLDPNKVYVSRISSGLTDDFGNSMPSGDSFSFMTGSLDQSISLIDDFEQDIMINWWAPQQSGSTTGIITDSTGVSVNTEIFNHLTNSTQSLQINYGWDTTAGSWLLREYLAGGNPKNVIFSNEDIMEIFLFGDGSGNIFRFCVDDNVPQSAAQNHEVSPWFTIDWIGWKRVRWDMSGDETGTWIGDGQLDGNLRFDSIQLSYASGGSEFGLIMVDDLRLVEEFQLAIDQNNVSKPVGFSLEQNFPNPFNQSTVIKYYLQKTTPVHLAVYDLTGRIVMVLDHSVRQAGVHLVYWNGKDQNGRDVPSGFYLYTLKSGTFVQTKKLLLLK